MQTAITATITDGITYYSTTRRGVAYMAYQTRQGEWFVSTKRLALGRFSPGGGRYYPDLATLARECAAFSALPALISETTASC